MKAIETRYKNRRFRSRQEARWAVFLDALGVPWEYEKEGYLLDDGISYLPDFWLPEQDCWLEIKGQEPTEEEQEKARRLAYHTGKDVYIHFGQLDNRHSKCYFFPAVQLEVAYGEQWEHTFPLQLPYQLTKAFDLLDSRSFTLTFTRYDEKLSIDLKDIATISNLVSRIQLLASGPLLEQLNIISNATDVLDQIAPELETPFTINVQPDIHRLSLISRFWRWTACEQCQAVGLSVDTIKHKSISGKLCDPDNYRLHDYVRIRTAFTAANEARFEFGETPN